MVLGRTSSLHAVLKAFSFCDSWSSQLSPWLEIRFIEYSRLTRAGSFAPHQHSQVTVGFTLARFHQWGVMTVCVSLKNRHFDLAIMDQLGLEIDVLYVPVP